MLLTEMRSHTQVGVGGKHEETFLWVLHLVVPLTLVLFFGWGYCYGPRWLHHILAPTITGLPNETARELGLIESLQHLLLVACLTLILRSFFYKPAYRPLKACLAVLVCWVLLEEIDYGYHYVTTLSGAPRWRHLNIHNYVDNFNYNLSWVAYFCSWLFSLASAIPKTSRMWRDWFPHRSFILTGPAFLSIHHLFNRVILGSLRPFGRHPLSGSIGNSPREFAELYAYLIVTLYLIYLSRGRSRGRLPETPTYAV